MEINGLSKINVDEIVFVCGVVVTGASSAKLLLPSPVLIFDSVSFAHELLEASVELVVTYRRLRNHDEATNELRVTAALKRWIEDQRQDVSTVPALACRALIKPAVVHQEGLSSYLRAAISQGKRADKRRKPQFLIDNSWTAQESCFYTTASFAAALRHAGQIAAEQLTEEELRRRLESLRAPWDCW